jgi:hypothetical protein
MWDLGFERPWRWFLLDSILEDGTSVGVMKPGVEALALSIHQTYASLSATLKDSMLRILDSRVLDIVAFRFCMSYLFSCSSFCGPMVMSSLAAAWK